MLSIAAVLAIAGSAMACPPKHKQRHSVKKQVVAIRQTSHLAVAPRVVTRVVYVDRPVYVREQVVVERPTYIREPVVEHSVFVRDYDRWDGTMYYRPRRDECYTPRPNWNSWNPGYTWRSDYGYHHR